MPDLKALVFDAYGTLFDPASVKAVCEELFPGRGEALTQLWRAKQLEYTWLRSLMKRYANFEQVTADSFLFGCKTLDLRCQKTELNRALAAYRKLELYPDVRAGLQALAAYRLAILSNGTRKMLQGVADETGIAPTFEAIMSADEAGTFKPSPRVYALAPKRLALRKATIGFVSSNCWDALGARAFGFWTCWLNRRGQPREELGLAPDVTVSSLVELAQLLATQE
jgi:2-haloacid dehalogenase